MTLRAVLLLLAFLAAAPAAAQEQAFANRATELKERGSSEARTLATLDEGTPLTVLARSGGWTRVAAGGREGWVRVFHLRFPATAEASSGSTAEGLASGLTSALGFGRSRSQSATIATTGIRGLSPEELRQASPDTDELRRMHSFRADRAAAERFAREGRLTAVEVAYQEGSR